MGIFALLALNELADASIPNHERFPIANFVRGSRAFLLVCKSNGLRLTVLSTLTPPRCDRANRGAEVGSVDSPAPAPAVSLGT